MIKKGNVDEIEEYNKGEGKKKQMSEDQIRKDIIGYKKRKKSMERRAKSSTSVFLRGEAKQRPQQVEHASTLSNNSNRDI